MKKEFFLIIIVGLFILSYVLDAVSNPLSLSLATPYHYFNQDTLTLYAFSTTSIIVKTLALFISILMIVSFIKSGLAKGGSTLLISALLQLYALQAVATNSQVLPLEWSLSLTLTGLALIIPSILFLIVGIIKALHHRISPSDSTPADTQDSKEL